MLTIFFIKIGKIKEKWLVIYKLICNLKFSQSCFLDKYTDSTCRAFSSVSSAGQWEQGQLFLQEYSCQCSGCFPELPFESHASILDFTHSNGIIIVILAVFMLEIQFGRRRLSDTMTVSVVAPALSLFSVRGWCVRAPGITNSSCKKLHREKIFSMFKELFRAHYRGTLS